MDKQVLLSGDVDAIKAYIFETSTLPQIRGGSQLLIECEEDICEFVKKLGGRVIYCGGGSFLFEVPAKQAEQIKQEIERIYLNKTLVTTVTVVYEKTTLVLPVSTAKSQDGWAARLWQATEQATFQKNDFVYHTVVLGAHLREAKLQKILAPFFEALPFGKRCESCGKRMAMCLVPRREPREQEVVEEIKVCCVCYTKHQKGQKGKTQTRGKFNEEFHRYCVQYYPLKAYQPRDLDELNESANRKYLAFVYADGNEIGGLLSKVKNEQEYHTISHALCEGTQQALFGALTEVCKMALSHEKCWPFEVVNIGGDDVIVLIQAGYAWEVAVKFLENFEREVRKHIHNRLGEDIEERSIPITASCGIVIADVNYPIQYLESLATGLLKRAKKLAKTDKDNPQSTLDFLWLPNPMMSERIEPFMSYYEREDYNLTARPYTLEQAQKLVELSQQASEWSRSQRHQWGEALEKGLWVSLNAIYYNIARRSDKERHDLIRFLNAVGAVIAASNQSQPSPLWKMEKREEHKTEFRTALLDVLELAELRAMRKDVKEREE